MKIRQVVVTGKNQVELQNLDLDESKLGADEILIETERTVISAGTELANYTAADPTVFTKGAWNAYPWKSGYGNVGIVRAVGGSGQTGAAKNPFVDKQAGGKEIPVAIGDRVFTFGPHSSHFIYSTRRLIVPVSAGVSLNEAAAARMGHVALTALDVASSPTGKWVVVFGLGLVGNLAAQLFRIAGAHVIGVDPAEKRRALARECGIPRTVTGSDDEVIAQIKQITDGKMAAISVDAVGHSTICMSCLKITASFGELIILGSPRVDVQGNLTDVFRPSHLRWITIKGALEWAQPQYPQMDNENSSLGKMQKIFGWLCDGRLQLKPLISHVLPPTQIKQAYNGLLNEKDNYTGVVLDWRNEIGS